MVQLMLSLLHQQQPPVIPNCQFIVALLVLVISGLYSAFFTQHYPFLPGPLFPCVVYDTFLFHLHLISASLSLFWGLLLLYLPTLQAPIHSLFFCSTFIDISLSITCILTTFKSLTPTLISLTKLQVNFSIGLLNTFT